jgi:quercetin dioxygenase-like cupin family protein
MQAWNLLEPEAPGGTRDPVVLHSTDEARAVLVVLNPGQELGDHEVKEHAWLAVVDGRVRVASGGETREAGPGTLFRFEPAERHSVASDDGARILLLLAPWPGVGHFRGGDGG